MPESIIHRRR